MNTGKSAMHHPEKKRADFRSLLIRSHMIIAFFGCLIMIMGIFSTVYLVRQTRKLTGTIEPIHFSSTAILKDINGSLASLRGWVNLGDNGFLMEWEKAWQEGINPSFKTITRHKDFLAHSKLDNLVAEINSLLIELKESQWWVLETANTPGNEPAKVISLLEIAPAVEEISRILDSLQTNIMSDNVTATQRQLTLLHELINSFVLLRLYLDKIILGGDMSLEDDFYEQFRLTKSAQKDLFRTLSKSGPLSNMQTYLNRELMAFYDYATEAIEIRKTEKWNVARFLMKTETLPLAQKVLFLSSSLADRTREVMVAASKAADKTGHVVIYGLVGMVLAMIISAYAVARKRAFVLATPVSELEKATREFTRTSQPEEVTIKGPTEIESLANSFNVMCRNLEEAHSKLIRHEKLVTIGQLSASVAHDIRNPIGAISNSIYYLNLIIDDKTDDKIREHLSIMEHEIHRTNEIINDLMDFSRENVPDLSKGDFNAFLKQLLSRFDFSDEVKVDLQLAADLPGIRFDHSQLQRVFTNLITNARQAMSEDGTLRIHTGHDDGSVRISINDTGQGIAKEDLPRIFEPLFTTKAKGVGLGLSIARDFVEKHGGTITVESEVGKGTTFEVRLPVRGNEKLGV